ncbi:MAG: GGDEF domain-containing protein [Phycisphaera sp.]|nr:MAG: GGDEF domain-containing protein [Phycisphaera sp.]
MMGGQGTSQGSFPGSHTPEPISAIVVLVGRTGLDAKLRLDPDIELIRVKSPLDAIGELANPVGASAERTVVIVGDGADIAGRSGTPEEFVAAVRRIEPEAVVYAAFEPNTPVPAAYQGVVEPTISTDELRKLIHGEPPAHEEHGETPIFETAPSSPEEEEAEPAFHPLMDDSADDSADESMGDEPAVAQQQDHVAPMPVSDPEPAQVVVHEPPAVSQTPPVEQEPRTGPSGGGPIVASAGDGALVAAMLGGRGMIEPAMDMLRARVGRADLEFISTTEPGAGTLRGAIAVEFDGKRFGYLASGDDPESLRPRSEHAEADQQLLQEHARWLAGWLALADQQRRLRAEAMTDRVSGAWNRRYFDRFLTAAIEQARDQRRMLTVLVFDLDNFKQFNDEMGHEAGDVILRETVNLLHSLTRPTDRICRIGGDEFAVIFYEPEGPRDQNSNHPENFEVVAERFQRAITEQRFPRLGIDAPGRLTISGGLATFPWDGATPDELLRKADQLAMESKRAGKNSITFGHKNNGE